MNRVIAVTATLATAAMAGTMVAAATVAPALAAPRPATVTPAQHTRPAGHAKPAVHAKQAEQAKTTGDAKTTAPAKEAVARPKAAERGPGFAATTIGSELDGGKYVTVVHCQGVDSPPPVTLAKQGTPLVVNGVGPSAKILAMLEAPNPYKTVYTCTVTVKERVPSKPKPVAKKAPKAHKKGCEIATGGRTTCTKPVTLNTGFGGLASQVKGHRPAG
jgi:hypothetical protein